AAVGLVVVPCRLGRQRRLRLNLALEAHDRRREQLDFVVAQIEVRHAQLVERQEHAALVEDTRIVKLRLEPAELRGVRYVGDEREVESRDQLRSFLRKIGPDRLRILQALDVVPSESSV